MDILSQRDFFSSDGGITLILPEKVFLLALTEAVFVVPDFSISASGILSV